MAIRGVQIGLPLSTRLIDATTLATLQLNTCNIVKHRSQLPNAEKLKLLSKLCRLIHIPRVCSEIQLFGGGNAPPDEDFSNHTKSPLRTSFYIAK